MYFIIYDFETTGRSPRFDQILQAGFICYDSKLNEISRLNLRSRINSDIIPSIGALKVNKLLISDLLEEKITSYEMINQLVKFLNKYSPATFLGYNSIHFDEEFLRQALWELFKYPYMTSTGNNYRGDIFNLSTSTHAFCSSSINVEKNENGRLNFKLESLSKINNFHIDDAHEAIADVIATKNLLKLIKNNSDELYSNFIQNTKINKLYEKIKNSNFFTFYGYYFSNHYVYLLSYLIDHPTYNNNLLAYDLRFDPTEIIDLDYESLKNLYYEKKFKGKKFNCFRKLKLNKQPSILNYTYGKDFLPYKSLSMNELNERNEIIDNEEFKNNLKKIMILEAENYEKIDEYEEETIYSQGINYKDKLIMNNFNLLEWEEKWKIASKFQDPRLQFFAAKHIYRNSPESLPRNIFKRVHEKLSERFNSLEKKKFTTLPSAMEEADSLSLEMENNNQDNFLKKQLEQYNIYINFLNEYYNNSNAQALKFDSNLSKKLFY